MEQDRLEYLLNQYANGLMSEGENVELDRWYENLNEQPGDLEELIKKSGGRENLINRLLSDFKKRKLKLKGPGKPLSVRYVAMAASVLLFMAIGLYLFKQPAKNVSEKKTAKLEKEISPIKPGTNKATLTLNNGEVLDLSQIQEGEIIVKQGLKIQKTKDGQLLYQAVSDKKATGFNTISVPRGGNYQVVLADGTQIWINASSTLKFPVHFSKTERFVELSGEAYFEVAPEKSRPFKVISKDQVVTVLGTHFNVNAYEDQDEVTTTLLEGSVRVLAASSAVSKVLKPGQQSLLKGNALRVSEADIDHVMAWKKGFFLFKDEDIHEIMEQISRWYDVEVVYEDGFENQHFGVYISKDKDIKSVLNLMQATKSVKFIIEGRTVKVMK